jgi:hypothetical protein
MDVKGLEVAIGVVVLAAMIWVCGRCAALRRDETGDDE